MMSVLSGVWNKPINIIYYIYTDSEYKTSNRIKGIRNIYWNSKWEDYEGGG